MKFKLLHDQYGRNLKHFEHGRKYISGNIIDSDKDLLRLNPANDPVHARFEVVPDTTPASPGVPYRNKQRPMTEQRPVPPATTTDFDSMSLGELRRMARDEGIDIQGIKGKEGLIEKLKETLQLS